MKRAAFPAGLAGWTIDASHALWRTTWRDARDAGNPPNRLNVDAAISQCVGLSGLCPELPDPSAWLDGATILYKGGMGQLFRRTFAFTAARSSVSSL